jgi:hypothetical protein
VRSGPIAIHPAILRIAASANQRIGRIRKKPAAETSQETVSQSPLRRFWTKRARADRGGSLLITSLNFKGKRVLAMQISSLSRRDETPSSTTGRNEIIDDRFWDKLRLPKIRFKNRSVGPPTGTTRAAIIEQRGGVASAPLPPPGREAHRALAIASRWVFAHHIDERCLRWRRQRRFAH